MPHRHTATTAITATATTTAISTVACRCPFIKRIALAHSHSCLYPAWPPIFRNGRLLRDLEVTALDHTIGLQGEEEEDLREAVEAVGHCCRDVQSLTLRGSGVTASVVGTIATLCGGRLRNLDMSQSSCDDDCLSAIADVGMPALEELRIIGCDAVTDDGIIALFPTDGGFCQSLEWLFLSQDAAGVSESSLLQLPAHIHVKRVGPAETMEVVVTDDSPEAEEVSMPAARASKVKKNGASVSSPTQPPGRAKRMGGGCVIS